jgi:hypothetical protein
VAPCGVFRGRWGKFTALRLCEVPFTERSRERSSGRQLNCGNVTLDQGSITVPLNDTHYDWIQLIRAEYLEVPGLVLTKPQAQRLWSLDERTCDSLLDALVGDGFLRKDVSNAYVRADG